VSFVVLLTLFYTLWASFSIVRNILYLIINPDFIKQLGTEYMSAAIQNSSPEDMMAFAETHKML